MEQDKENRQAEPVQPEEKDLFNLTDEDTRQAETAGQPSGAAGEPLGEPEFKVDSNLSTIDVLLHTSIPNNDDAWETDESPAQDLEYKLNRYFGNLKNVRTEVKYKPDADGNCVIELSMYVVDSDHFGDEHIDAYRTLGEEY